jgi:hypothetical protein
MILQNESRCSQQDKTSIFSLPNLSLKYRLPSEHRIDVGFGNPSEPHHSQAKTWLVHQVWSTTLAMVASRICPPGSHWLNHDAGVEE